MEWEIVWLFKIFADIDGIEIELDNLPMLKIY